MPRRWRGPITLENVQTGDGRVTAPGGIEWADLPLPLSWMSDGASLHLDLATATPQVGNVETITREGDEIMGEGWVFDGDNEEGTEVIRRMDAGEAPLGTRFPVSIDPDNWEVEIILTDAGEAEDILIMFSGEGALPSRAELRAMVAGALRAAAGDPDPGEDGGEEGELLFQDSVDEILERYTRLRIRGATLCDIAAYDGAAIELTAEASDAAPATEPPETEEELTARAAANMARSRLAAGVVAALEIPNRPPLEWFRMPEPEAGDERLVQQVDGGWAVPFTITDDGQWFGHIARRDQAHRGYSSYVPPPVSRTGYREFHTGEVVCADGTHLPTGAMIVGCEHATLELTMGEARDHYAHAGQGWGDGRVIDGVYGPWACGALRPTVTEADLRVLRALAMSGDWRPEGGGLEMCSVLAVNVPGFPIAREAMAASALAASGIPEITRAQARVAGGALVALTSAGMVTRCSECAERERERQALAAGLASTDRVLAALEDHRTLLRRLDARTRHLEPEAMAAALGRARGEGR